MPLMKVTHLTTCRWPLIIMLIRRRYVNRCIISMWLMSIYVRSRISTETLFLTKLTANKSYLQSCIVSRQFTETSDTGITLDIEAEVVTWYSMQCNQHYITLDIEVEVVTWYSMQCNQHYIARIVLRGR